jgi:hypothetical protein
MIPFTNSIRNIVSTPHPFISIPFITRNHRVKQVEDKLGEVFFNHKPSRFTNGPIYYKDKTTRTYGPDFENLTLEDASQGYVVCEYEFARKGGKYFDYARDATGDYVKILGYYAYDTSDRHQFFISLNTSKAEIHKILSGCHSLENPQESLYFNRKVGVVPHPSIFNIQLWEDLEGDTHTPLEIFYKIYGIRHGQLEEDGTLRDIEPSCSKD